MRLVNIREVEKEIVSSRHRDFIVGKVFFHCSSIDEQSSYVRAFFEKSLTMQRFLLALFFIILIKNTKMKLFFVHISSVFEARLKLIAASVT